MTVECMSWVETRGHFHGGTRFYRKKKEQILIGKSSNNQQH